MYFSCEPILPENGPFFQGEAPVSTHEEDRQTCPRTYHLGMPFVSDTTREKDEWRSIVLFGRNVATYKFALARSLIELARDGREAVTLEELAVPFARNLCQHLDEVETQGTFQHSRFLDACRYYNAGVIDHDELITATAQCRIQKRH